MINSINNSTNYNFKKYKGNTSSKNIYSINNKLVNNSNVQTEEVKIDTNKITKESDKLKNWCSHTGLFEDLTDYQKVALANLHNFNWSEDVPKNTIINKKFSDLYGTDGYGALKFFIDSKKKDKYGFGDFTLVEVIETENSMSAVVIKDADGNYMVHYLCSNERKVRDVIYDITPLLGVSNWSPINQNQQTDAIDLAYKYYEIAQKEGKKLNISGYSLGGSLAEEAYLFLVGGRGEGAIGYDDNQNTVNSLSLFNPYHSDLSDSQVDKIKKCKNLSIICNEGDPVSSAFNRESFAEETKYIYIDYESYYKKSTSKIGKNVIDFGAIAMTKFHSIDAAMQGTVNFDVFNDDGSVKEYITENGVSRKTHSISVEQLYFDYNSNYDHE